jgi:hypothetical protein
MGTSQKPVPVQTAFQYRDGTVTIGDKGYRCHSFKALSVLNELPIVQIVIQPDDKNQAARSNSSKVAERYRQAYDEMFATLLGTTVTVTYNLIGNLRDGKTDPGKLPGVNKKLSVVFKGILTGWAPIWVGNTMQFTLWASSDLAVLNWASSRLDAIHGLGINDMLLPTILSKDEELVPFLRGKYQDSNVSADIWKELIKPELIALCELDRAGGINSKEAAAALNNSNIDKSPLAMGLKVDDPLSVIIHIRKTLMGSRAGRGTLWERFRDVLVQYKLSIIFRLTDYMVAPVVHSLGGENPNINYPFGEFVNVNRYNAVMRSMVESISTIPNSGAYTGFFDTVNKAQAAVNNDIGKLRRGYYVGTFPPWLDRSWSPLQFTAKTLGLGEDPLYSPGYLMKEPASSEDEKTANVLYNEAATGDMMKAYSDTVFSERAYQGVGILKGGINFDIAPGSLVQTEMPCYRHPGEIKFKNFFGLAWSVCVVLDGTQRTGTWVTLRNVRTEDEQGKVQWKEHPMYKKRFVRAPFNPIKGLTHDLEVG